MIIKPYNGLALGCGTGQKKMKDLTTSGYGCDLTQMNSIG